MCTAVRLPTYLNKCSLMMTELKFISFHFLVNLQCTAGKLVITVHIVVQISTCKDVQDINIWHVYSSKLRAVRYSLHQFSFLCFTTWEFSFTFNKTWLSQHEKLFLQKYFLDMPVCTHTYWLPSFSHRVRQDAASASSVMFALSVCLPFEPCLVLHYIVRDRQTVSTGLTHYRPYKRMI